MVLASAAFSAMGVFVKLAAVTYGTFEIVLWRGALGAAMLGAVAATTATGGLLHRRIFASAMHFW